MRSLVTFKGLKDITTSNLNQAYEMCHNLCIDLNQCSNNDYNLSPGNSQD